MTEFAPPLADRDIYHGFLTFDSPTSTHECKVAITIVEISGQANCCG
jgi:hypothetical protein